MLNLVIIGNGFDRAHDLQTSYNQFIEYLLDHCFKNKELFHSIFKKCPDNITSYKELIDEIRKHPILDSKSESKSYHSSSPRFLNSFVELLLHQFAIYNWCEIERVYFDELMRLKKQGRSPLQLNENFDKVKEFLSNYLIEEEKKAKKINCYSTLFKYFPRENSLILNFNYTRTIEKLYSEDLKCPIIHIHGELENRDNPIIFGYAATHAESRDLLSQNDNEYLKNIKKHLYKRTKNENQLLDFLSSASYRTTPYNKIKVFVLGHSCGLSDNLILNEIFNNEALYSIRTFYYQNYQNYFDVQVNIDRIMANDEKFKSLVINYMMSHRMPQHDDSDDQISNFKEYLKAINQEGPKPPDFTGVFF